MPDTPDDSSKPDKYKNLFHMMADKGLPMPPAVAPARVGRLPTNRILPQDVNPWAMSSSVLGMAERITRKKPEAVDPLVEAFKKDMAEGRMPQAQIEQDRLVDSNHPAMIAFQEKMTVIAKKLLGKRYDPALHDFSFAVQDSPEANAGVICEGPRPNICFTTGLLRKLNTEDELAAVLAHELTHKQIFDRIGVHKVSNLEEAGSDVWAVYALQRAGYNPRAMQLVLDLLPEKPLAPVSLLGLLKSVSDPHPPLAIRKRNTGMGIGALEEKGRLNTVDTPIDAGLRDSVTGLRHQSYLDGKLAALHYHTLGTEAKIAALRGLADSEFLGMHGLYAARIEDFADAIKKLKPEAAGHEQALNDLARHLVNSETQVPHVPQNVRRYCRAVAIALGAVKEEQVAYAPLMGELAVLHRAMDAFKDATTRSDALAAARTITAVAKAWRFGHSRVLDDISWPQMVPPERKDIEFSQARGQPLELPWCRQAQWARDGGEGADIILEALRHFNIDDPAIVKGQKPDFIPICPDKPDWAGLKWSLAEAKLDAQGRVTLPVKKEQKPLSTRFKDKNSEQLASSERRVLDAIDAQQRQALQTVDWRELEQDFWAFAAKHREHLMPQVSVVDGGWAFAEAFMTHVQALYSREPDKYGPLLHEFFSGAAPSLPVMVGSKPKPHIVSMQSDFHYEHLVSPGLVNLTRRSSSMVGFGRIFGGKDEEVSDWVQIGIAAKHPYTRFVLQAPEAVLTTKEKLNFMRNTRYIHPDVVTAEGIVAFDARSLLGYAKPNNGDELLKACQLLGTYKDHYDLMKTVAWAEIYHYLEQQKPGRVDLAALSNVFPMRGTHKFSYQQTSDDKHRKIFRVFLDDQVRRNLEVELKPGALPAGELIRSYKFYNSGTDMGSLFVSMPEKRQAYEQAIMQAVDALGDAAAKKAHTEELLFNHDLRDAGFRSWAIRTWAESQASLLGEDTQTPEYKKHFSAICTTVLEKARMGQAPFMVTALLDNVKAQEVLSFAVRDQLFDTLLRKGGKMHLLASGNDHVMGALGGEPAFRQGILDFLTGPLDDKACEKMLKEIKTLRSKHPTETVDFLCKEYDKNGMPIPETAKFQILGDMHKNFWSLPFAARTVYLERVLFPVGDTAAAQNFPKAVTFVLDKVVPLDKAYGPEARKILLTHMEQCGEELQRLMLSALISASERSPSQPDTLRPGQVLSMVLGRSGAAGAKILQAVHSHLSAQDTSKDPALAQFRDDIKSAKTAHDLPMRWTIFERLNEVVEPENRASITRVDECLGAGAYGYAVKIRRGKDASAMTLLRDGVEEEAKYHFDRFGVTAKKLAKDDAKWKPLVGILQHARDMSDVECDFNVAAVQIDLAGKLYNGIKAKVGGHQFSIDTAGLLTHGQKYKETVLAQGVHFNDLPEASAEDLAYKKAAAKALFTTELHIIMRGGPFDHDRHGGQQRILKLSPTQSRIVLFDHGAMALSEPSVAEKQVLGRVLVDSYKESEARRIPFADALLNRLSDTASYSAGASYLEALKRGLLAMGDYRRYLSDAEVQQSILTIVKTGGADKTILSAVSSGLGAAALGKIGASVGASDVELSDPHIGMGAKAAVAAYQVATGIASKVRRLFSWGKPLANDNTTPPPASPPPPLPPGDEGGLPERTSLAPRGGVDSRMGGGYSGQAPRKINENPDSFKNPDRFQRGGGA